MMLYSRVGRVTKNHLMLCNTLCRGILRHSRSGHDFWSALATVRVPIRQSRVIYFTIEHGPGS